MLRPLLRRLGRGFRNSLVPIFTILSEASGDPSTLEENYQMVWKGEGQGSYAATSYKEFQKGRLERNRPLSLPKWGSRTSCPV